MTTSASSRGCSRSSANCCRDEPRIGIGNTRFGAQVAAVVGRGRLETIETGDAAVEAAYLAPLSIRLLPADDDTRERLRVFGLTHDR